MKEMACSNILLASRLLRANNALGQQQFGMPSTATFRIGLHLTTVPLGRYQDYSYSASSRRRARRSTSYDHRAVLCCRKRGFRSASTYCLHPCVSVPASCSSVSLMRFQSTLPQHLYIERAHDVFPSSDKLLKGPHSNQEKEVVEDSCRDADFYFPWLRNRRVAGISSPSFAAKAVWKTYTPVNAEPSPVKKTNTSDSAVKIKKTPVKTERKIKEAKPSQVIKYNKAVVNKRKGIFYASAKVQENVIKHIQDTFLNGSSHFGSYDGTICVFNPGESSLPLTLAESGLKRLVVLESDTVFARQWAEKLSSHREAVVHNVNFLQSYQTYIESVKENGVGHSLFHKLFPHQAPHPNNSLHFKSPALLFVGALPRAYERSIFYNLIRMRQNQDSLFWWGRVEFLLYVSASEAAMLSSQPDFDWRVQRRNQDLRLLFDYELVHGKECSSRDFGGQNTTPAKICYANLVKMKEMDPHSYHLLHLKTKERPGFAEESIDDSQLPLLLFFRHQLMKNNKCSSVLSALRACVSRAEEHLTPELRKRLKGRTVGKTGLALQIELFRKVLIPYRASILTRFNELPEKVDPFFAEFMRNQEMARGSLVSDLDIHDEIANDELKAAFRCTLQREPLVI